MKLRRIPILLLAVVLIVCCASCAAEGITLRTVSCFAGDDLAAGVYVEILKRYEAETGNTVRDTSSSSDEAWKSSVLNDFAAGNEPRSMLLSSCGRAWTRFSRGTMRSRRAAKKASQLARVIPSSCSFSQ